MKKTIQRLADRLIDEAGMIGLAAESLPSDCGISGAEATLHLRDAQNALNASMDALRTALAQRHDAPPAGEQCLFGKDA